MKFPKQLARIIFGYLAATLVALLAGLLLPWLSPGPGAGNPELFSLDTIAMAGIFWLLLAFVTFVPALVAIAIAEAIKLRSLLAHILIGGFIGFLCTGQAARISPWLNVLDVPMQSAFGSAIIVIAGALGALAYWQIAGKHAGKWRES